LHKTCGTLTSCRNCTYDCPNSPGQENRDIHNFSASLRGNLGQQEPLRPEMRVPVACAIRVEKRRCGVRGQMRTIPRERGMRSDWLGRATQEAAPPFPRGELVAKEANDLGAGQITNSFGLRACVLHHFHQHLSSFSRIAYPSQECNASTAHTIRGPQSDLKTKPIDRCHGCFR
jgi:hypothetical protein